MIPVNVPKLGGNEKKYLINCIETGWISSEGPYVTQFEEGFAETVDRQFGIACSSGSAALDIAVAALGIGTGDEVIMPSFTIISPALSVVRAGATPVLLDSDPKTWNIRAEDIEEKITERTKAILVVHIYGLPVDMNPVLEVAKKHNLLVIEDAAEMHGQQCRKSPCGSFGDISTFSFYPNKHITTGEGGMLVVDCEDLAQKCRNFRNLCFQPQRRFVHNELGWNYRMTNMQAALGVAQLEQLESNVLRKREIGSRYLTNLSGTPGIRLPLSSTEYADNIFWVFGIVIEEDSPCKVESVTDKLRELEIGTRPFFWPMHQQPVFRNAGLFENDCLPVSEHLARNGFYVPSGLGITDTEIDLVCESLISIL